MITDSAAAGSLPIFRAAPRMLAFNIESVLPV